MTAECECPICCDSIVPGEVGVTDPCGHVFHLSCWNNLEESLSGTNDTVTCPICQRRVSKIIKVFGLDCSSSASQQAEEISRLEKENADLKKRKGRKEEHLEKINAKLKRTAETQAEEIYRLEEENANLKKREGDKEEYLGKKNAKLKRTVETQAEEISRLEEENESLKKRKGHKEEYLENKNSKLKRTAEMKSEDILRLQKENLKLKRWKSHKEEAEKRDKRLARALQKLA